ncbi:transmembrane protein 65 isoform X2 [Leptinotarsa decemlineata]|uniref:transmembrane protein 65 isoform X2 n=1 Tax=Leptinotarsa decemlineata TaxID=7539 RepID=UPI000C253BB6|nr:transmembrane protein 65 isoform X2 [Leptinotarsa decemlineata]
MAIKIARTKHLPNLLNNLIPILHPQQSKLTNFVKCTSFMNSNVNNCKLSLSSVISGSAGHAETTSTTQGLSKLQAQELILRLNGEERNILMSALHEYQSKVIKDEYEAASVPRPSTKNLFDIAIANSIPFIGFGFLDNFFMLIFGDYIDLYLGSYFCFTTMGAAALGNTISDILGIGSAFYVERLANRIGFRPPRLSPIQLDMPCSRNSANAGRVLGVTLGCILGMCPLLFRKNKNSDKEEKDTENVLVVG